MVSPLNRKLLRDLWRIKGQATAIGVVIGVGVMLLVMMTGLTASLTETRDAYYDRYRLADIFAPASRAPERLTTRLAAIPGVAAVQSRVQGRALIDIPGQVLPVQAQAVSQPDRGRPAINDVYLTDGRLPASGRPDEILLLQSFALAHDLHPGDQLNATMNGARRSFGVVGLAQSPEFLYTTAPGELIPDDARFGVIWMSRSGLAAAYDMNGAFNEVLISLTRDANLETTLTAVDRLLAPYGGFGAYARADQTSNRFVTEEISGLVAAAIGVPPIFLLVAAFLLYIVIGRIVQSERGQIGLMKAFGYTDGELGAHYSKLILAIALGGALAGCLAGIAAGRALVGIYTDYFKFPFLVFQLEPSSFLLGIAVSLLAASAGGFMVLRQVFGLLPAAAMRPPTPPDFSRAGHLSGALGRFLDQPSRMVLRRIIRQPGRMAASMLGIALGMALSVAMITIYAGFDRTIDLSFSVVDRSDVRVGFTHPVSTKTLFELDRLPGVVRVEATRTVPAVMSNGLHTYRGGLIGIPAGAELSRAIDRELKPILLPPRGVVLSSALARILDVEIGDVLDVDVREGRQPVLQLAVAGIAETLLGSPAFMSLEGMNRALGDTRRVSGAYLMIDQAYADDIYMALQNMPTVAGVSLKSQARDAFVTLMNTGAGAIRYVMGAIAFIITFGIVYNAARIAYAERARDLASLRVIGFTRAETAFVLLGELAVVTLVALPVGAVLGYYLSFGIAAGFSTDLYQITANFDGPSHGQAALVVMVAAIVSGLLVKRDLDRSDLIEVLKTRE